MSVANSAAGSSMSVGFEPLSEVRDSLIHSPDFSKFPIVQRILERIGQQLLELGRRARRVGPVDAGTIVLLAGCHEGSGCTTAALAMAAAASAEGPTGLIDADLSSRKPEIRNSKSDGGIPEFGVLDIVSAQRRNRTLTQILLSGTTVGWNEVISGTAAIDEVLHHIDSREALAFFPKSNRFEASFPIADFGFSHAGLAGWLGRLRQDFGMVFLDAGSVENRAMHWAPWVDAALIVSDPSQARDSDWTKAWDRLEESGTHVLGIIETRV